MRTLYFTKRLANDMARKCFVVNVSPLFRELILYSCTQLGWKWNRSEERRIIEVILDQLRLSSAIPLQLPQPRDARAIRVVNLLIKDPSDRKTLKELCNHAGGSKRTIERIFVEETGMTFGKWRQQLRLFHGMRLLASGEKITTAALESGYSSASAFISVFKKILGAPPTQYFSKEVPCLMYQKNG